MALRPAHFEYNSACVPEMKASGMLVPDLMEIAEKAAVAAKLLALTHAFETGAYMASINPVLSGGKVSLIATDHKANWIEFGTHPEDPYTDMYPRHILRRAFEAIGMPLSTTGQGSGAR